VTQTEKPERWEVERSQPCRGSLKQREEANGWRSGETAKRRFCGCWGKKYAGLGLSELRELLAFERTFAIQFMLN
jgi:hypothetical protein